VPTLFIRVTLASFYLSLALLHTNRAEAQGPLPVELAWTAPPGCPMRQSVLTDIAREVGPSGGRVRGVTAAAVVTSDDRGRWRTNLVVEIGTARGQRLLEAQTCEGLAAAAALIVAIAIETGAPPAAASPPAPIAPSAPAPPPPTAPDRTSPMPPPAPATDRPRRDSKLLIGVAGVVDSGTLPAIAPGLEASAGWSYGTSVWRGRLLASGEYFASETGGAAGRPTEGGRFTLLTVAGRVCGSRTFWRFEVGPCIGGELDAMSGQGVNSALPGSGDGQWAALIGSLFTTWRIVGPLGVSLRLDAVAPLVRPTFVLTEPGNTVTTVHQAAAVSPRASLGVELRFF
jgi:hypothetical protein